MPRTARIKNENSIFHIMVRSVGDILLYKNNNDKEKFLNLVKRYQNKFCFKMYAYCVMSNHSHFIIDVNGSDISDIMHGINQSYAQYFNKKYKRHGHVFQDRFKSKIIDSDKYLITLSAYIHNNPNDMKKYKNCVEKYKYSSLGTYLGIAKDVFEILDENFIMRFFGKDLKEARQNYIKHVYASTDVDLKKEFEFKNEKTKYISERKIIKRNFTPKDVVKIVSKFTGVKKNLIFLKYNHKSLESKALAIFLMSGFCQFRYKDICKLIGNITESRTSVLCTIGSKLASKQGKYSSIVEGLLQSKTA